MRRLSLLFAPLLVVPLLGSDSPKGYDDKTEIIGIEGTWRLTEFEKSGKKVILFHQCVITYRNGAFEANEGDGRVIQGSYRVDRTRNPPQLDRILTNGNGKTIKAIYQMDGNTLRIASIPSQDTMQRPQGFNDKGIFITTCKRVK